MKVLADWLAGVGLVLGFAGVLLIYFGTAIILRSGGFLSPPPELRQKEKRRSRLGLAFVAAAFALQFAALIVGLWE